VSAWLTTLESVVAEKNAVKIRSLAQVKQDLGESSATLKGASIVELLGLSEDVRRDVVKSAEAIDV
jgi:hypothetical protein